MEKIGLSGNYNLTRSSVNELGRGSFSIVYKACYVGSDNKYIKNNTIVAIKIIKTNNLTFKAKEILEDEIKIMEIIKDNPHTNIVECYDVIRNEQKNELYIILEYCDSGDLRSILKKPIKEKYAQFYFCQLANGLKYLDNNCIIHRDIKPRNILLTDKRRVLKIADFGFAKKYTEQTLHETMCGSPLYMAPEIMNNNMYNNQTDLWSIGMILYEMLYGTHPFNNCKTIPELRDSISKITIEIPPSNTKNKDVSKICIMLLKKLLEKKVNERISWFDFFDNQWIKQYQCDYQKNQISNDYEKKLQSTSLGSLGSPSNESLESLDKLKLIKNKKLETHTIKISKINNLTIVDNYYDEPSNKTKPIAIKSNKHNDEEIFEMDEEYSNKNLIIRQFIDNSSILDDTDNNYDIIESL